MGIRAATREDLQATSAELVLGETIRLPGQFLTTTSRRNQEEHDYLKTLKKAMEHLQPRLRRHGEEATFIFKDLTKTPKVFLRRDAPSRALQAPYDGPYEVLQRDEKTYKLRIKGKSVRVSIDRLKPAYTLEETTDTETKSQKPTPIITRSGKHAKPTVRFTQN
ncbi:PREDICTED: uncharacterized protein LOC108770613 [Trachymyrmex cornetzi]|uniref:uncharacterized protein LOC108770613 n=1 Tax=Trachymyrmex cornetzi TaxID=471704 RepID=UPI00084F4CF1|nr:PREDICTED: uncharacterized protein LOC108770613 [Trachymyrmex cornetzi]